MSVDLTKFVLHSAYPGFKNNREYSGTGTISGTQSAGVNTRTINIELDEEPDLLDVSFYGHSASAVSPRPSNAWFKSGAIGVNSSYNGGYETTWFMSWRMVSPTTLQIVAQYIAQYSGSYSLTSTNFDYKIIDYSAL